MLKKIISIVLTMFACLSLNIDMAFAQNTIDENDPRCMGFSLIYHNYDGYSNKEVFIKSNDKYTLLETPVRDEYKFEGWYYNSELYKPVLDSRAANLNNSYKTYANYSCPAIDLYAKWSKLGINNYQDCNKGFKLKYHYNNGTSDEEVYVRNDGIFGLTTPNKDGYKFMGWYYDSNFTIPVNVIMEKDLSDRYKVSTTNNCKLIHIYAKWEKEVSYMTEEMCGGYNLKCFTNDGNTRDNIFISIDDKISTIYTPTKSGHKFMGWYYDEKLTIPVETNKISEFLKQYREYSKTTCPTIKIYAKWEKEVSYMTEETCGGYNLKCFTNDGVARNNLFISIDDKISTIYTPTKSGYKFMGWYYDEKLTIPVKTNKISEFQKQYREYSKTSCPTIKVYAKWEKEETKPATTPKTEETKPATTPKTEETKPATTPKTEETKPVTTPKTETPKQVITNKTEETCGGYNLKYFTNDGNTKDTIFISINDQNSELYTPTRNGYKFIGWYYDEKLTTPVETNKISKISKQHREYSKTTCPVIKIYAKWEKDEKNSALSKCDNFSLIYHPNNGQESKTINVEYKDASLKLEKPEKQGYIFNGWYYDSELKNPVNTDIAAYLSQSYLVSMNDECPSLEVYAEWIKKFNNEIITILIPESISNNISKMEVKKYTDEQEISQFKKLEELSNVKFQAYEIDLYDQSNNKVQPNGHIQVELDIPDYLDKNNLILYRLENNKLISYDIQIVNKKIVFETDHFSTYILAEKNIVKNKSNKSIYIIVAVLLIVAVIWIRNSRVQKY